MASFVAFWKLVSPWLLTSLIPSIITGLSLSPKTSGFVPLLQKVIAAFSWLTHKDEPGTFKVPLKRKGKKASPAVAAVLCLIFASQVSCAAWLQKGEQVVVDCGLPAVQKVALSFLSTVVSIFLKKPFNMQAQLDALKGISKEALACATRDAVGELNQLAQVKKGNLMVSSSGVQADPVQAANGAKAAGEYLNSLNVVFAPGK